ncbi:Wzy polymerase domain-containing protein [Neptuniibacter sp. 1_MG-2023]|uniref:Wzy polymerase domain-containing protein n=1 Tax=Neptuniibacter sp. 1_MG-2023 TaxID=3062662 RepID=UPI0026E36526|nr:Wzy polymerase domain-containing protein [Neptuniibacter sp. 1_MG-2023]MDO6592401.1 Wzy polymerase domain-containing protein [Neptuniibacter sp. 1_MG-2023]
MILGQQLEHDPSLKKPQRLFFILFGCLFLIAPFYYQPNLGGEGLFLPYNGAIWIVASWIIASASFLIYKNQKIVLPKYWLGLALFPIGALATGFIADKNNPTEWIVRLSVIIGGYLFFLSLFQFQLKSKHIERSLYIILAMGLIAAAYGVIQTLTGATNLAFMMPVSTNHSPVGIFQQVNLQASFMATLLVLTYYLSSRPTVRTFSFLIQATLLIAALGASYNIATSGSRVGLLGAALGLLCLFIGRWKLFRQTKIIFIALIIATLAGGILGKSGLEKTADKVDRAIGGVSADVRWHIYSLSLDIFAQAPLIGHGLGSFQKVFQEERIEYQQQTDSSLRSSPRFSHPHNELIFWLVEGGIVSIIGILAAAIYTLVQLFKAGWQRGWGYAALLFPLVFHTQVELPFYISNTHWFLLLFLLFLTHQHGKKSVKTQKLSMAAQRTIPISFVAISIFTTITLIQTQIASAGIVSYLQRNQSQPQYLRSSLESAYFREYTTYLLLRRNMLIGISNHNKKPAQDYIDWAEQSVKVTPAIVTYRDLAIAYDIIGKEQERDQVLNKALSMFPTHSGLLELQQKLRIKDKNALKTKNVESSSQAQPQASQP